jgi:hypothetical protein
LLSWDSRTGKGTLMITDKGREDRYVVERLPADCGEGYLMLKTSEPDCDVYAISLDRRDGFHSCECLGWLRHSHCRHVGALLALGTTGKI